MKGGLPAIIVVFAGLVCTAACGSTTTKPVPSWSPAHLPTVTGPAGLKGVACPSPTDCWAVGFQTKGGEQTTLIENWDGRSWREAPSPSVANQSNYLAAVTCVSASFCWAVGYTDSGSLVLQFDGRSWAIHKAASNEPPATALGGVACVSSSNCWSVGVGGQLGTTTTSVIEHWDGGQWVSVDHPTSGSIEALYGIGCTSAGACTAAGLDTSSSEALVDVYDGSSWSVARTPPGSNLELHAVACSAADRCWIAGDEAITTGKASGYPRTALLRLTGGGWNRFQSANTSATESNYLLSVTCVTGADCWAVGATCACVQGSSSNNPQHVLIEHFVGTTWQLASGAADSGPFDYLAGVTCVGINDCWAVGGSGQLPLILHYS